MSVCDFPGFGLTAALVASYLDREYGRQTRIGLEKEFYFIGGDIAAFNAELQDALPAATEFFLHFDREEGPRQFEYALSDTNCLEALTAAVLTCDNEIRAAAIRCGGVASFSPQPFEDCPTSGMHVHLSLHDSQTGHNVFAKRDGAVDGPETRDLLFTISGLQRTMCPLMIAFAPTGECYKRLKKQPYPSVQFAPINVSWGANNRSVALRVPPSGIEPHRRRIEHRLPSSIADISKVLVSVLAGVWVGIRDEIEPLTSKIHCLANHPDLTLPPLPYSLGRSATWYVCSGRPTLEALSIEIYKAGLRNNLIGP